MALGIDSSTMDADRSGDGVRGQRTLPLWAVFVGAAVLFFGLRVLIETVFGAAPSDDLLLNLAAALVWSAVFTAVVWRQRRALVRSGLTLAEFRELNRAVRRGEQPTGERLRAQVPAHARTLARQARVMLIVVPVLAAVATAATLLVALGGADGAGPVFAVLAGMWTLVGVIGFRYSAQLLKRTQRLIQAS